MRPPEALFFLRLCTCLSVRQAEVQGPTPQRGQSLGLSTRRGFPSPSAKFEPIHFHWSRPRATLCHNLPPPSARQHPPTKRFTTTSALVTKKTILVLFTAIRKMKTGGEWVLLSKSDTKQHHKNFFRSLLSGAQGPPQPAHSHSQGPATGLLTIPNPRQQRPREGSPLSTTRSSLAGTVSSGPEGRQVGSGHNTQSDLSPSPLLPGPPTPQPSSSPTLVPQVHPTSGAIVTHHKCHLTQPSHQLWQVGARGN